MSQYSKSQVRNISISATTHDAARRFAKQNGMFLKALVEHALIEFIDRNNHSVTTRTDKY